jgi:hypothetical protein
MNPTRIAELRLLSGSSPRKLHDAQWAIAYRAALGEALDEIERSRTETAHHAARVAELDRRYAAVAYLKRRYGAAKAWSLNNEVAIKALAEGRAAVVPIDADAKAVAVSYHEGMSRADWYRDVVAAMRLDKPTENNHAQ